MEILRVIEHAEKLLESQGIGKSKLAKELGFSSRYVADIKAGKSKNPSPDFILALINRLNFSPEWLETGNGEVFRQELPSLSGHDLTKAGNSLKIPLLRQKVSCGQGADWEDEQNIKGYIDIFSLVPRLKPERLFALSVQGNSMVGAGIRSGDYVLFTAENSQYFDDDIYVFALDGDVYCKQLEFDGISKRIKIYSIRVADLEKAELLTTLNIEDADFADRFRIFGRVFSWVHPNFDNE